MLDVGDCWTPAADAQRSRISRPSEQMMKTQRCSLAVCNPTLRPGYYRKHVGLRLTDHLRTRDSLMGARETQLPGMPTTR
jgi:hypothetical protein